MSTKMVVRQNALSQLKKPSKNETVIVVVVVIVDVNFNIKQMSRNSKLYALCKHLPNYQGSKCKLYFCKEICVSDTKLVRLLWIFVTSILQYKSC